MGNMAHEALRIVDDGIRHPKLGNAVLSWEEILYVDYREIKNARGHEGEVLIFTLTPQAMTRLNYELPFYRRFLLPFIFGNTLMIDITGEPLLDPSSEFTAGVQIFQVIEKHVPKRERVAESNIEGQAEVLNVAHSLTTAISTPRPPRRWSDGTALFLTALGIFAALMALIMVPAYFFA